VADESVDRGPNPRAAPAGAGRGSQASQPRFGLLLLGVAAILSFFAAVGLILYLKPGDSSPAPAIFVAGPVEGFMPGSVSYFEHEHVFIVRLTDGAFLALYDLGPKMQSWVERGTLDKLNCRAHEGELPDGIAEQPGLPVGFEKTGFIQPCAGGYWDATGKGIWGPLNGDLDRFPVSVVDGIVRVDLANRRCMNPVSAEAPCLATQ